MTKRLDFYRCEICGNIVQVLVEGEGELVCCGEAMKKLNGINHEEILNEKHIPFFIKGENGESIIQVGSELHPMLDEHYIMFIEAISSDKSRIELKYFRPGDEPRMYMNKDFGVSTAYEFCNIHGLWEAKND